MLRIAVFCSTRATWVILAWLLVAVAGAAVTAGVSSRLSQAPDTDLKVLATGLGAGILLDATIVRALLVPALLSLFGSANWWLPPLLARLLRIPASPAHPSRQVPPIPQPTGQP